MNANCSFVVQLGDNHPVISAHTHLLHVPISRHPASMLTECFRCFGTGHYREDCPSTSALTATFPPQNTLKLLVCPPSATFVADGDIALDSVPLECVTYVIEEVTLLTIARLLFFPLNRLPISLGIPLTRDRRLPHGVLIEPGVRLYKGGNVTIHLLSHGIFLLSFLRHTHLLFGMCSYDWVHCLIL